MKRKNEFELYLQANYTASTAQHYMAYCNDVEKLTGKDMDDIIVSCQEIIAAKAALDAKYAPSSVTQILCGFNAYLQFAFSAKTSSPASYLTIPVPSLYHVSRAEDVPLTDDVAFICETLEQEYANVVRFAKMLFPQVDLKYIPIIISNQEPMHDSPDGGEKILGAFFASEKPYIEIYYRNADPHDAASFRKCLSHEYMHYMHYVYAGKEYDNANKELKEALADFFGVLYSIHRGQKDDLGVAKARYNSWKKNFGTYWPYANALYFYQVHGNELKFTFDYKRYEEFGCIGKLIQIFYTTRRPDDAYNAMKEN